MRNLFTFLLAIIINSTGTAQIPNSSFEVWDSSAGYKMPVGWDNLNPVTNPVSVYTCSDGTPGHMGDYYLNLTTRDVPGLGMMPGIALSGKLDPVTHTGVSGFPFSSRPQVLSGYWQYMAFSSSDQGYISILLTKWNTATIKRDTIAYTLFALPGMVMFWQPFAIPIDYLNTANPDSAMIFLSSSGATIAPFAASSFLWVDDLVFSDSATLGIHQFHAPQKSLELYPNPAKEHFTISYYSLSGKNVTIYISDLSGRIINSLTLNVSKGNNKIPVNTALLVKGFYLIKIADEEGVKEEKLVIE